MYNWYSRIVITTFVIFALFKLGCKDNAVQLPEFANSTATTDEGASCSPDGKWTAYTHIDPETNDTTTYPSGLYLIDTIGQNRRLVIRGSVYNPRWSSDSRTIAFNSGDIFIISYSGDSLKQLTSLGASFFPSWSPDNSKIAFGHSGSPDSVGIWIVDVQTLQITHWGIGGDPDWSPDGTKFLFAGATSPYTTGITVVSINNPTDEKILLNNGNDNRDPRWSPDASKISWWKASSQIEIWIMNSDGTNQRKLTEGLYPSWSDDSRQIIFSSLDPKRNKTVLWKVKIDGSKLVQLTY